MRVRLVYYEATGMRVGSMRVGILALDVEEKGRRVIYACLQRLGMKWVATDPPEGVLQGGRRVVVVDGHRVEPRLRGARELPEMKEVPSLPAYRRQRRGRRRSPPGP